MLTGDPHQGNTVLQMRAQELPAGQRLASLGPGLGRQPHMRISGTTGIECHMRSITPMAGGALANTSPFHNLGSGTGLPARSARPRNHPQAGPEIVPHDAFHNGRTEPAPVRQPPRARRPVSRSARESRGQTEGRPKKKACGVVSLRRYCPDQVLGVAVQPLSCPGLSAFPSRLRLPGGWCGPAPSITSQTMLKLRGADDGRPGPKAPACTGQRHGSGAS